MSRKQTTRRSDNPYIGGDAAKRSRIFGGDICPDTIRRLKLAPRVYAEHTASDCAGESGRVREMARCWSENMVQRSVGGQGRAGESCFIVVAVK